MCLILNGKKETVLSYVNLLIKNGQRLSWRVEPVFISNGESEIVTTYVTALKKSLGYKSEFALFERSDAALTRFYIDKFSYSGCAMVEFIKKGSLTALQVLFNEYGLNDKEEEAIIEYRIDDVVPIYISKYELESGNDALFIKKAASELILEYIDRYELSSEAEKELVKRRDAKLIEAYREKYEFCEKADELYLEILAGE